MLIRLNSDGSYFMGNSRLLVHSKSLRFGTTWFVYDAQWVTDSEIREGKSAPTVANFDTLEEALHYCQRVLSGELTTEPHESNFEGWPELKQRVAQAAAKPAPLAD